MCDCAQRVVFKLGRTADYMRAKTILNRAQHPTFIGRASFARWAGGGGLIFATLDDDDVGVSLINTNNDSWQVMSIVRQHQGHGLGGAFARYLTPSWARVPENRVSVFEGYGYVKVGVGWQARAQRVFLMVRAHLLDVPHRLAEQRSDRTCSCHLHDVPHDEHDETSAA